MAPSPTSTSSGDFVVPPQTTDQNDRIMRSVLCATDCAMLVASVDGQILAANTAFETLFSFDPGEALSHSLRSLRTRLADSLKNPEKWFNTDCDTSDVHEMFTSRRVVLRTSCSQMSESIGVPSGYLLSFRDITKEHRQQEIYEIVQQVNELYDPSPEVVLHRILEVVSKYYDETTAILSLRRERHMDFREVVGPDSILKRVPGNWLEDSFCKFALSSMRPVIIQDAMSDQLYCRMSGARAGLTRYLGVPVFGDDVQPIGTLCLMDGKSDQPLDELDVQFMTLLAVRVTSELARERHLYEMLAKQEYEFIKEREDLDATNAVLAAMNAAFSLLSSASGVEELLTAQTRILAGVLGYEGCAALLKRKHEDHFAGFAVAARDGKVVKVSSITGEVNDLSRALRCTVSDCIERMDANVGRLLLVFTADGKIELDERRRMHLDALADQVLLLISAFLLQEELVQSNHRLSTTQQDLLRAEKLSVVGTLAASTAHDLRNITSSLTMLVHPDMGSPESAVEAIREQLSRYNVVAQRLLSYAKPTLTDMQPVDLVEVAEAVLRLTDGQLRMCRVQVVRDFARNLPPISAEPQQLEHVLVNLIVNSAQAMNATGGTLTISMKASRSKFSLRISDTGPGIPATIRDRLFQPFSSTRPEGFGLGLYSCKRIVEGHGGSISVSSREGVGTTFTVELPIGAKR